MFNSNSLLLPPNLQEKYQPKRSLEIPTLKSEPTQLVSHGVKEKVTVRQLRDMCKEYNDSVCIKNYSKASRKDLKRMLKEKNVL